ncbi:Trm112p-domain-containing protein [Fragilariopsis cylindrus CCMP1102]|uniref:Trm112p-domain-containing protein n=1 Tax=Fragilariopsis cylindrus CCMP1102 TaxID=635003 RepID=A0A1E7FR19_9STRA|nr:Trm112p-domain-containing protein [Fragilariopsis cylindrus CCMP1102]|eukprot:OEU20598.1 Trm112p-domain-containing protein [Fragilariopsis cylindrus CCMP1102]
MRLLTHNFLQSNVRGTVDGYPLKIEGTNIVVENSSMDSNLVRKVLPKLNYPALVAAINDIRNEEGEEDNNNNISESVLKALHFFLFDVHVIEGCLICPGTDRRFPIKDGIPNMILHEDEV